MKVLKQSFSVQFQYPVWFTREFLDSGSAILTEVLSSDQQPKVLLVIDQMVHQLHPYIESQWHAFGSNHQPKCHIIKDPLIIPGGEACKNDPAIIDALVAAIHKYEIDRHSFVLAIGGGAVLDAVGYAAAIAHRGVRMIRVPTTVLAQNDSGVGVKNGINAFHKKNFLGTFAPPFAVINDSNFLHTLDNRDWRAGIAEAIKVALIKDAKFFDSIEKDIDLLNQRDHDSMESLIYQCARMHMEHIAAGDPFEQGSSRPLDFGHWSAHKLEQLTDYQIRHGEAVAIGMAIDCTYAHLKGYLSETNLRRILSMLTRLGFDLFDDTLMSDELVKGLQEFREHLGGKLTILLLDQIGSSFEVNEMDETLIISSIAYLKQYQNKPT